MAQTTLIRNFIPLFLLAAANCRDGPKPTGSPSPTPADQPLFADITERSHVDLKHKNNASADFAMPEIMGAGGAIFDYDNDGDLDLFFIHGRPATGPADAIARNQLLRRDADGTYRDVTDESGLGGNGHGMGCALGDIDNDGDLDLFLTNVGPDALYRNNGDGTFTDITASAGVADDAWSMSACFFDYDRDGFLDLYVTHYVAYDPAIKCRDADGAPDYCGPEKFDGVADTLFRNNGDPRAPAFTDVSESTGIAKSPRKGLGLICLDFNDDHRPDVYVTNDGQPHQLWINRPEGGATRFVDEAMERGVALNAAGRTTAGMGTAAGDVDNDGDLDLFITNLAGESNTFYLNTGRGNFVDATENARLAAPSLPFTGFGAAFFDFDLDGDLDLAVANGRVFRDEPWSGAKLDPLMNFYAEPNLLFENTGTARFTDINSRGGPLTKSIEVSRGLMNGDLDGDGDLDVVVTHCGGRARVYRNDAPRQGHWLIVRAVDPRLARDAVCAHVILVAGGRSMRRDITHTQGYLTSTDAAAHFGLGSATTIEKLTVRWPDGLEESFPPPNVDCRVTLVRGRGQAVTTDDR